MKSSSCEVNVRRYMECTTVSFQMQPMRCFRGIFKLIHLPRYSAALNPMSVICYQEPPSKKLCTMPTDNVVLKFAKITDNAKTPTRGTKSAAGYDLYSAYNYTIPARGKVIAKTDIQIALPDGCYGRVAPRSGLAAKHFIDVGAGVIDQDYRGNVGVVMFNFSETDFEVKSGDRIAQLVCERIYIPQLEEFEKLEDTERGSGGFGSTGKN